MPVLSSSWVLFVLLSSSQWMAFTPSTPENNTQQNCETSGKVLKDSRPDFIVKTFCAYIDPKILKKSDNEVQKEFPIYRETLIIKQLKFSRKGGKKGGVKA